MITMAQRPEDEMQQAYKMAAPVDAYAQPVDPHDALTAPLSAPAPKVAGMSAGAPEPASGKMSALQPQTDRISKRLMADYQKDENPYGVGNSNPGIFRKILHGLNVATGGVSRRQDEEMGLEKRLQDIGKLESQQNLQASQADENEAMAGFTRERPDLMKSQLGQKTQTAREKYAADLRKKGINVTGFDEESGLPLTEDDPDTMAYQHSAAENYIHMANAEKAQILGNIAKNKYVPGTPEYDEEHRKLAQIDRKINIAQGNLGMRQDEYKAHAYGTDRGGEALPGSMLMDDGTPVGTWNAQNVRPTTEQRNAGGRADIVRQLGQHLAQEMDDPEIRQYLGPGSGRIAEIEASGGVLPEKVARFRNDMISYGAFQAGFHPVRGIGALQYFEKVMGGLGQTPESLKGKLLSNEDTGKMVQQTGTPKVAKGKPSEPTVKKFNPKTGRLE